MPRRPGSSTGLDPTPLPPVHLSRDHPRWHVAAQIRAGAWVRVRAGACVEADPELDAYAWQRVMALAHLVAVRRQLRVEHSVSHQSAAVLWGLPMVGPMTTTHVVQRSKPTSRGASDVIRHVHELPDDHRTVHRGHAVTTLERTLVDCAMALPPDRGLVIADAALRAGADRARCRSILDARAGGRGAPRASEVLAVADDGAESPGESAARLATLRAGLPAPETQVPVVTRLGTYWADLGWREYRLLAEYDGVAKYTANGSAGDAVLREKMRQDAIEEAGWRVLRLVAADLRRPAAVADRFARMVGRDRLDRPRPRPLLLA